MPVSSSGCPVESIVDANPRAARADERHGKRAFPHLAGLREARSLDVLRRGVFHPRAVRSVRPAAALLDAGLLSARADGEGVRCVRRAGKPRLREMGAGQGESEAGHDLRRPLFPQHRVPPADFPFLPSSHGRFGAPDRDLAHQRTPFLSLLLTPSCRSISGSAPCSSCSSSTSLRSPPPRSAPRSTRSSPSPSPRRSPPRRRR